MIIEIAPNYELFVKILLAVWILKGIGNILAGILHIDSRREKAGNVEFIAGIIMLLIVIWVSL